MPNALVPLGSFTLASSQASVTFVGISTTSFKDLHLVASWKHTTTNAQAGIRLNGDTTNYSHTGIAGWPSGVSSWSNTSAGAIWCMNYSAPDSAQTVPLIADFISCSATDRTKLALLRSNHSNEVDAVVALWSSTAAINSITIFPDAGSFAAGSTFNLYGIL